MADATPAPQDPAETAAAWATLLERLVRGLEGGSREWTIGRRKDSVRRVIAANRRDLARLQQRLEPLIGAWEQDRAPGTAVQTVDEEAADATPAAAVPVAAGPAPAPPAAEAWPPLVASLEHTVRSALPGTEPRAAEIADALAAAARRIAAEGATAAVAAEVDGLCQRARRLIAHRHHLLDELADLCAGLTDGLTELAEDDSWARGQAQAMRERLADGINARGVRAVGELLADTRSRQARVRAERDAARDALRALIPLLQSEVAALDAHTGRYEGEVGRHAAAIEQAISGGTGGAGAAGGPEALAGVARLLLEETRAVRAQVSGARARMAEESAKAGALQSRVLELESELRRLSDEVSIDALTQVANRRGLQSAFETEVAKLDRAATAGQPALLAAGLIDIDNFKKLNDSLGHAAGDKALAALAAGVRERLRPVDHVARFGGEEFVVLLPGVDAPEAQQVLSRLQRDLSKALFMHDNREVFVTFSAGVTAYRRGETLAAALERADEALYEAKRTGKNRTCLG